MRVIKQSGLILFLLGLAIFIGTIFTGDFNLTQSELNAFIAEKEYKNEVIKEKLTKAIVTNEDLNIFEFSSRVINAYDISNRHYDKLITKYDAERNWTKKGEQYQYKIFGKPHSLSFTLAKKAGRGFVAENKGLAWLFNFWFRNNWCTFIYNSGCYFVRKTRNKK